MNDPLQPDRCARLLRVFGDPDRLRIIRCLSEGPRNVGQIARALGAQVVNVSHHLGVLRAAGLVEDVKRGRYVIYHLNPEVYKRSRSSAGVERLDLGCCCLQIPRAEDPAVGAE